MLGFSHPLTKTLRNLLVLFGILWVMGKVLEFSTPALLLHNYSLGTVPSHNFLDRTADLALAKQQKSIMLLGPSTVREGFDENLVSELTGYTVANCGVTSKGSISHTETQLDIIANFGLKPDVLVLGLNSRMLSARRNPLVSTGYINYLTGTQIEQHQKQQLVQGQKFVPSPTIDWIATSNNIWPVNRISQRLDYVLRYALMQLNMFAGNWNKVPMSGFSRGSDLLLHQGDFLYSDERFNQEIFDRHWQGMEKANLLQKARYGQKQDVQTMFRVITKAKAISHQVIVVIMPEHSKARNHFGSWGDQSFHFVLETFQEDIHVLDFSSLVPDYYLRDIGHLVPSGRALLSRKTAKYLNSEIL